MPGFVEEALVPPVGLKVVEAGAPEEFKFNAGVVVVVPGTCGFEPLPEVVLLRFKEGIIPLC